jgi:hypothetical protein
MPLPEVYCIIACKDTNYHLFSDFNGKIIINHSEIEKIQASFVGMKPCVYQNDDRSYNFFTFTLLPERDDYEYLTNKELLIKADKLFDFSIKKNKCIKTNYYIKVRNKKACW